MVRRLSNSDGSSSALSLMQGRFDGPALQTACNILDVLDRYRSVLPSNVEDRSDEGNLKFLSIIYGQVRTQRAIQLVLPAFPFKSPNRQSKTLGSLPDKGEEISLAHLNGLCAAIADIYSPGAKLTIASDGLVYNDLLGVPDREVWEYGQNLRAMVREKELSNITFVHLRDLLYMVNEIALDAKTYEERAPQFREDLIRIHTPSDHDVNERIASDEDVCTTYRGYIKFLTTDLAHTMGDSTKSQHKKKCEQIAKKMIVRGAAFAQAIAKTFPDHVRLSIHPSNGSRKISISVLPQTVSPVTPWHSAPYFSIDGHMKFEHRDTLGSDEKTELVSRNGQPWYFREKSDLYSLSSDVSVEFNYPCGITIQAVNGTRPSFKDVDMQKLRLLSQENSPVVLRGFRDTLDRDIFVEKAEEMGTPVGWKFGLILEVKDHGSDGKGLNNVLSAEWMPYHYDGLFKIKKEIDSDGNEKVVSLPPKFQMFTAITSSPENTGYTLFAPSHLVFANLPLFLPLSTLSPLTWTVRTTSFDDAVIPNLPLVIPHPATGRPSLRYHEPWPQEKTAFDPTSVTIDGVENSDAVCAVLDGLLHDRRVCYWHSWEEGDFLVSDNFVVSLVGMIFIVD
ncbi:isocyanide synthase family protein [Aspergillus affinis]|uniref:isocyanide synthase family protein n=1 Tax=Aspergillus affinis TaxID=1070780 RepID=UPI0022FDE637|nr:putative pyoverdine/dityrosine biosynthesis protein [Aspergillus affinis]KAI9036231.1 putative pyoverdine/dityrosine biosynthesis protein [Aspergillus affinis]